MIQWIVVAYVISAPCLLVVAFAASIISTIPPHEDECPDGCPTPTVLPWYWNSASWFCGECGRRHRLVTNPDMTRRWESGPVRRVVPRPAVADVDVRFPAPDKSALVLVRESGLLGVLGVPAVGAPDLPPSGTVRAHDSSSFL
jgi:hypothetical protein